MLLSGCGETKQAIPEAFFQAKEWPNNKKIATDPKATQKDVAIYITRGHTAYKSCVSNLDSLNNLLNKSN